MMDEPYWIEAFKNPADEVDTDRIEALIVAKGPRDRRRGAGSRRNAA